MFIRIIYEPMPLRHDNDYEIKYYNTENLLFNDCGFTVELEDHKNFDCYLFSQIKEMKISETDFKNYH